MKEKLVLVGNGMAGMRTIEEVLKLAPDAYDVTVFGEEPRGNYNRIMLSPVLSGEASFESTLINPPDWYAERGITLHAGNAVVRIDRRRRTVVAADGIAAKYDRLVLATGSRSVRLAVPGADLDGVIGFRTIDDVERMLAAADCGRHAVVIGGGLLGLEAAAGLRRRGMRVRVVHLGETLLDRQLDATAGEMLRKALEADGIEFLMGAATREIIGRDRVRGVAFEDGREVSADLVVMGVGIRPEVELARRAGLFCGRGIVVNDTLQTYDPRIYAVGECVEHRRRTYGLVAPLFEMAKVCANHLARLGYARYLGSDASTKLKVTGIDLFSAGEIDGDGESEQLLLHDPGRGVYKKLVLRENRVRGVVLYGDTMDGPWYFQLLRERTNVGAFRDALLFGQTRLGDAGNAGAAACMDENSEVCGCNGVSKGDIVRAVSEHGLFTLEEVRAHTKASASCGGCTPLVEQILASVVGGDYSTTERKPLCGCTDFTHEEVRRAIRERHLTELGTAMRVLDWRNPDGCPACRPALNYYLLAAWPGEVRDDPLARLVNERRHANIQKDRTFTVVPRMWGGLTSPQELRAIASVAERHSVPMVKLTGGQRIDLVGLRAEQLPAVWAELNTAGLISGHAYGKAVRTVKTCIGSRFCRFGTQDAVQTGIDLERLTWGSWTPHKFKMAVSGCPRNCAEATIKDFGVVAVESGWELHVGGNGGVKVRVTDRLCRVETAEQVLEHAGAFLQLYREEGRYLERTAGWIERVGLAYVKGRIVDDAAARAALYARFLNAQRYAQQDPWRAQADEAKTFTPPLRIDRPARLELT